MRDMRVGGVGAVAWLSCGKVGVAGLGFRMSGAAGHLSRLRQARDSVTTSSSRGLVCPTVSHERSIERSTCCLAV